MFLNLKQHYEKRLLMRHAKCAPYLILAEYVCLKTEYFIFSTANTFKGSTAIILPAIREPSISTLYASESKYTP